MRSSWVRLFARRTVKNRKQFPEAKPSVDRLEDRWAPATLQVTNTLDDGSVGSLRWAVAQADNNPNGDTITINVSGTINLVNGPLYLTDGAQTAIQGPGANLLTVSGNNISNVFVIYSDTSAVLSGLKITQAMGQVVAASSTMAR